MAAGLQGLRPDYGVWLDAGNRRLALGRKGRWGRGGRKAGACNGRQDPRSEHVEPDRFLHGANIMPNRAVDWSFEGTETFGFC